MEKIPTARTFLQNLIEENNQDSNIDLEETALSKWMFKHVLCNIENMLTTHEIPNCFHS